VHVHVHVNVLRARACPCTYLCACPCAYPCTCARTWTHPHVLGMRMHTHVRTRACTSLSAITAPYACACTCAYTSLSVNHRPIRMYMRMRMHVPPCLCASLPIDRPHCISAVSRLHLGCISVVSRLHLGYITAHRPRSSEYSATQHRLQAIKEEALPALLSALVLLLRHACLHELELCAPVLFSQVDGHL